MKTTRFWFKPAPLLAALPLAALAVACFCGCESADSYEISVKPGNATVTSAAPSVALTASGWRDFQWALSDTSLGYLSSSKGDSVVYTARSGSFAGGRQTITVTAVGSGTSGSSSSSSTNATASAGGYTAQAIVTHKDETVVETETAETESGTSGATDPSASKTEEKPKLSLSLDPASKTVTNLDSFLIKVKEPDAAVSYSWRLNGGGNLTGTGAFSRYYTPPSSVQDGDSATVTCTASRKGYESAEASCFIVFNPADTTPRLNPVSLTDVQTNETHTIRVANPVAGHEYRWTVSSGGGNVSPQKGTTTTYTAPSSKPSRSHTITCTDEANGNHATLTVSFADN